MQSFSALKYQGRRLSDRAIKGEEMPHISPRVVRLHAAECISFMSPFFTISKFKIIKINRHA